jgi:Dynamin family
MWLSSSSIVAMPPQGLTDISSETQPETSDSSKPVVERLESASLGIGSFASSQKELKPLFDSLSEVGIERANISTPKIVVIGNQSAGKSSLIESISSVRLPRGSGTCTRCPMEFVLQPSNVVSCEISLRIQYDDHIPGSLRKHGSHLFARVKDTDEVSLFLSRAQAALLNPTRPLKEFIDLDLEKATGPPPLGFTKNAVVLKLTGPEQPAITFVDLPGIISNTEKV